MIERNFIQWTDQQRDLDFVEFGRNFWNFFVILISFGSQQ